VKPILAPLAALLLAPLAAQQAVGETVIALLAFRFHGVVLEAAKP